MPSLFCLLGLLCLSAWTEAATMNASIHSIDYGHQMGDEPLVYLSNGRVVRLSHFDHAMIEKMHQGIKNDTWFSISLNHRKEIKSLTPMKRKLATSKMEAPALQEAYQPSIVPIEKAINFFYESMPSTQESQCYNRAHVWTHEWRIKNSFYSNKIWLFFTRKYIREYEFDWWFHVAPYFHVVEDGKVRERVMDVKYGRGPIKIKQWTDIFLKDDAPCPVVEKYSDQANYPEWGSCFVMKSSMYYYQPVDLERKEVFGVERTTWIPAEIIEAYREAFNIDLKGSSL